MQQKNIEGEQPPIIQVDELAEKRQEREQGSKLKLKDRSPEEQAEDIEKAESEKYLNDRCKTAKSILHEENVKALLLAVQDWPENWMEQAGQQKDEIKKQIVEALKIEDKDEKTQNMIFEAVGEVLKENKIASKLDPPPASTFLKGITTQLDLINERHLKNWKSWYNTDEGKIDRQRILTSVNRQNQDGDQIAA